MRYNAPIMDIRRSGTAGFVIPSYTLHRQAAILKCNCFVTLSAASLTLSLAVVIVLM